ncbi:MAG: galactose-1-phosphate uridylyltransferase [Ignavibacteria bacterium RIFCSPLOWO2_02_FULL_55_14]|nr:MAG: galactose-1-phosphate uridylyltransferase [Ignavibacteria bacterium RIFCSPLOWO2_02_FULL_55_14]
MPELRQNIITRDWVIIATERARRPETFVSRREKRAALPLHDPSCPFCPGNESQTSAESLRIGDEAAWRTRVVANKFPALVREGMLSRRMSGIHRSMQAVGYHDVVVEHPRHDAQLPLLREEEIFDVLSAYQRRYVQVREDGRVETILIFRNHGVAAGTSQPHPHSQIVGLPVVPAQVRMRLEIATRYFDETGECMFCRTVKDERSSGDRIIFATKHFLSFIPYAALSPFHTWIYPLRHMSSFESCTEDELRDLARCLKSVLGRLFHGLNDPDYNLLIRSLPTHLVQTDYFHWYMSIVPRIAISAGFELGSGMFINTAIPEQSAEFLRGIGEAK